MSTTTAPTIGANTPNPAIVEAKTQNDMLRVIVNDPGLQAAAISVLEGLLTGDKSLLQSKTFWAAIITPIVGYVVTKYAVGLDDATVYSIDTVLEMGMMMVMRVFTNKPVTGIAIPASKS